MKKLLIEVDDELAAKLEVVAPGRTRRRSQFVRHAIRQALWQLEEAATAKAYRQQPDSADDTYLDPTVWQVRPRRRRRRR